jgi:hypothetical protein
MSESGHKPRRRSGPGASLCPQYLRSRRNLCTAVIDANANHDLTHRNKNILLDYFVGASKQWYRDREAECFGDLEIDSQLDFRDLLYR